MCVSWAQYDSCVVGRGAMCSQSAESDGSVFGERSDVFVGEDQGDVCVIGRRAMCAPSGAERCVCCWAEGAACIVGSRAKCVSEGAERCVCRGVRVMWFGGRRAMCFGEDAQRWLFRGRRRAMAVSYAGRRAWRGAERCVCVSVQSDVFREGGGERRRRAMCVSGDAERWDCCT